MRLTLIASTLFFLASCQMHSNKEVTFASDVELIILGNVQDGGSPHIGCNKECCAELFVNPDSKRKVVSLGLVDRKNKKTYVFEATPDFGEQAKYLKKAANFGESEVPNGVFLTHAHIGHYSGLMLLGKEAMDARNVPVYAMPRMDSFLRQNGPWSQLVNRKNIQLKSLTEGISITLADSLSVTPFLVPHRDEYSETVGYRIDGPTRSALFIPDIDKWTKWNNDISKAIEDVDYAFVDGTFYDGKEISHRDISQIPHPFVSESLELFKDLSKEEKGKIHFIHFNHTNPLLNHGSSQSSKVLQSGFRIARMGDVHGM